MSDPDSRRRALLLGGALAPLAGWSTTSAATPQAGAASGPVDLPQWTLRPRTTADIVSALKAAPAPLRPVGAGYSVPDLRTTPGTQIDTRALHGLVGWNPSRSRIRVRAGTSLAELQQLLAERDLALPIFCHAQSLTVAGAVATSTHGISAQSSSLSGLLTAAQLVTPAGEVLEISELENPEWLPAVACNLGALGILTEVELDVVSAQRWRETVHSLPLREALQNLAAADGRPAQHAVWIYPHSDRVIERTLVPTTALMESSAECAREGTQLLEWLTRIGHGVPPLDGTLQTLLTWLQRPRTCLREATQVPSPWSGIAYHEMAYHLPRAQGLDCVLALREALRVAPMTMMLPLEVAPVAADSGWLSPFYRRDAYAISLRQWQGVDPAALFALAEPIFQRYGGRPHWGKVHTMDATALAALYPRWADFQALRATLDPEQRLMTPALRRLLG